MFHSILSSITNKAVSRATHKESIAHPRDASTRESFTAPTNKGINSKPKGSLWRIIGTGEDECEHIVPETEIEVQDGYIKMECNEMERCEKFRIQLMKYLHRHMPDCVQWTYEDEEFGILFSCPADAARFCKMYCQEIETNCERLWSCKNCQLMENESGSSEFVPVSGSVTAVIARCLHDPEEHYLFIKSNEGLICAVRFDMETSFYQFQKECIIGWWKSIPFGEELCSRVQGIKMPSQTSLKCCWEECQQVRKDIVTSCYQVSSSQRESSQLQWMDVDSDEESVESENEEDLRHEALTVCRDTAYAAKTQCGERNSQIYVYTVDRNGKKRLKTKMCPKELCARPSSMIIQDNGGKLLVNDRSTRCSLALLDLNTEKVIRTWQDNITVDGLCQWNAPTSSSDSTCLGYNENSLFTLDPREKNIHRPTKLTYSVNPKFTCASTTECGQIAMGSAQGSVRLYDGEPCSDGDFKRAKTVIKIGSSPIVNITSTRDGSWILITCQTFLAVVCVQVSNKNGNATGFTTRLAKDSAKPVILRIKVKDVMQYGLSEVRLTKACFDVKETHIITSTENLILTWNFDKIKCGEEPEYEINKRQEVVAEVQHCETGGVETLIVATPNAIESQPLTRSGIVHN